jgi:hypothetical protein
MLDAVVTVEQQGGSNANAASLATQLVDAVSSTINTTLTIYPPTNDTATSDTLNNLLEELHVQFSAYVGGTQNTTVVDNVVADIAYAVLSSIMETYGFPGSADAGGGAVTDQFAVEKQSAILIVSSLRAVRYNKLENANPISSSSTFSSRQASQSS